MTVNGTQRSTRTWSRAGGNRGDLTVSTHSALTRPPPGDPRGPVPAGKTPRPSPRKRSRWTGHGLPLHGVYGNLTADKAGTLTAWYAERPVSWSPKSKDRKRQLVTNRAQAIAGLADAGVPGLRMRTVHTAFPVREWARAHHEWSLESGGPAPDVPGALSWRDLQIGNQTALIRRASTRKTVFWGVRLPARALIARTLDGCANLPLAPAWLRGMAARMTQREIKALADDLARVDRLMARAGMGAAPASDPHMAMLLHSSATLGLPLAEELPPAVAEMGPEDLQAFSDAAAVDAEPRAGCVRVVSATGEQRFVAIRTIGHVGEIDELDDPWLVWADNLPWPVAISQFVEIPGTEQVARELGGEVRRLRQQLRHMTIEHDVEVPDGLADKVQHGIARKHQIENDPTGLLRQVQVWTRFAVSGPTPEAANARAEHLAAAYGSQVRLDIAEGQPRQWAEFLPGAKLCSPAYRRRMPLRMLAAGVPSATDRLGDRHGIPIGELARLTRRPAFWDPWMAHEIFHASGLTPVLAGLGGGKSFLSGWLVYHAVRSGAYGIVLDPSGRLGQLAHLPEFAGMVRVVDLLRAKPGQLNPYRLVTGARRGDFPAGPDGDLEFEWARSADDSERMSFVLDILRMLLPPENKSREELSALRAAVQAVGPGPANHPGMVLDALAESGHRELAEVLRGVSKQAQARAIFPEPESPDTFVETADARLTVLSLAGLSLPEPGTDEGQWTDAQRMALPMVHLAAWLTHKLVYDMPVEVRKMVFLDEYKYLSGYGSGHMLMVRMERDNRKYHARIFVASQVAEDFLVLPGFATLTHEVIVGQMPAAAAAGALTLLKLPRGAGFEEELAALNSAGGAREESHDPDTLAAQAAAGVDDGPREFLFRIGDDVEVVRADFSAFTHLGHVTDALRTAPGTAGTKAA